jgi:hypothetical protein
MARLIGGGCLALRIAIANTCAGRGIRVTSGDPVATSLQTSLQEWTLLRIATGNFHPEDFPSGVQVFLY